jgi:uncharacterized protein
MDLSRVQAKMSSQPPPDIVAPSDDNERNRKEDDMSGPAQGTFLWNELAAKDPAKSGALYADLLGWETAEVPMPDGTYTLFRSGGNDSGGMYQILPEHGPMPQAWISYVAVDDVDDVDAAAAKVKALGGEVLTEPFDVPNTGRICIITDPDGGTLGLMKPAG